MVNARKIYLGGVFVIFLILITGCTQPGKSPEEIELEMQRLEIEREKLELEKAKLEQSSQTTSPPTPETTPPPTTPTPTPTTPTPVTLFSDDFSGDFPGNDWIINNYYADVTSEISGDKGNPSLKLSGDTLTTANAWPTSDGTEFKMKIAFPSDEECTGSGVTITLDPINRAGGYALITVIQKSCEAGGGTSIKYWGYPIKGYQARQSESIGKGMMDDSSHEFSFKVMPDGTVEIRRNGNLKLRENPQDLLFLKDPLPRSMKLSVTGGVIYIDDFQVIG